MSITEEVSFDKDGRIERFPLIKKLFLALVIILVATLSFGIGRLTSEPSRQGIKVEYDPALQSASAITSLPSNLPTSNLQTSVVVGSKNGAKYHYPHCPGAKQIAEKNKVVFASPTVAEASGYTLAANCKLK